MCVCVSVFGIYERLLIDLITTLMVVIVAVESCLFVDVVVTVI